MDVGPNKAVAAGVTGAASIVLVWALEQFHVVMPPEVADAVGCIASTIAVYFVPHGGEA